MISTVDDFGTAFVKGAAGKRSKLSTQTIGAKSWLIGWTGAAPGIILTAKRLWVLIPGPRAFFVWLCGLSPGTPAVSSVLGHVCQIV